DADHNNSTSSPISESIGLRTITPIVTVNNKSYDGTTSAIIGSRALNGIVSGDEVSLGTSGVAIFNDATIGTAKPVSVSGLTLTGAAAGNYVLTSDTVLTTGNIASAPLTIIGLSAENKIYDATTTVTLTGTP